MSACRHPPSEARAIACRSRGKTHLLCVEVAKAPQRSAPRSDCDACRRPDRCPFITMATSARPLFEGSSRKTTRSHARKIGRLRAAGVCGCDRNPPRPGIKSLMVMVESGQRRRDPERRHTSIDASSAATVPTCPADWSLDAWEVLHSEEMGALTSSSLPQLLRRSGVR